MNKINCEVLIIGSGAGGSTVFKELAGVFDVVMVEEGNLTFENLDKLDIYEALTTSYRNGGIHPALGFPSVNIGEGVMVGGSTEVNGGLFWRAPDYILSEWANFGTMNPLLDELPDIYTELEKELVASSLYPIAGKDIDSLKLEIGAKLLNWKVVDAIRIANGCQRHNRCAVGCTSHSKRTMSSTFIPEGKAKGGQVLRGYKAQKIIHGKNQKITTFIGKTGVLEVHSNIVILSCGAIETPRLLYRSGMIMRNRWSIGFHSNLKVLAEFEDSVNAEQGTIFTSQVQEFIEQGILFMAANLDKPLLAASSQFLSDKVFNTIKEDFAKFAMYTVQVRNDSRIKDLIPKKEKLSLYIKYSESDKKLIKDALIKSAENIFAGGAIRIFLPFPDGMAESFTEARLKIENSKFRYFSISTVHIMNSIPLRILGENKEFEYCNFKEDNIFVMDASILPSTLGESPQETIMAVSRFLARRILLN